MMCEHFQEGVCGLASEHAGVPALIPEGACDHCDRTLNQITAGLAIVALRLPLPEGKRYLLPYITVSPQGVGTELKKLISWFPIPKKGRCRSCLSLEKKLNSWGPDKCAGKLPYILKKLRIAAQRRSIPFSTTLATTLINKAIRNARKS